MTNIIDIELKNDKIVRKNFLALADELPKTLYGAGLESKDMLLRTKGLKRYPPATEANFPPVPYYKRGVGMQQHGVRHDGRRFISGNLKNSEQLGKKWNTISYLKTGVKIYNTASYAPHVHGDKQARAMARIGWLKLFETAKSKIADINKIYNKWVNQLLKSRGMLGK